MTQDEIKEALTRAERKLSAYVGVCKGDKELTGTVLPLVRRVLAALEARELIAEPSDHEAEGAMRYVMARQAEDEPTS